MCDSYNTLCCLFRFRSVHNQAVASEMEAQIASQHQENYTKDAIKRMYY